MSESERDAAPVVPIDVPSRSELWARIQLARSLLSHRPCTEQTKNVVLAALAGEEINVGS